MVRQHKGGFSCSPSWHVKEEHKGEALAVLITKESTQKEGRFKTGFSLNVIRNASKKTGSLPSEYAKQLINKMVSGTESSQVGPVGDGIHFKGWGGLFHSKSPKEGTIYFQIFTALYRALLPQRTM